MVKVISPIVKGWFLKGWTAYKKNLKPIIGGALIVSGFSIFIELFGRFLPKGLELVFMVVTIIFGPVLYVGWLFLCLRLVRDEEAKASDIFRAFDRLVQVWLTGIILFGIILAGIILLIIPGIIWRIKYGLSLFAVMDKSMTAKEAIKFSGKTTYGYKRKLFETWLAILALNFLVYPYQYVLEHIGEKLNPIMLVAGIVLFPVAVLIITPWTTATWAAAYNEVVQAADIAS